MLKTHYCRHGCFPLQLSATTLLTGETLFSRPLTMHFPNNLDTHLLTLPSQADTPLLSSSPTDQASTQPYFPHLCAGHGCRYVLHAVASAGVFPIWGKYPSARLTYALLPCLAVCCCSSLTSWCQTCFGYWMPHSPYHNSMLGSDTSRRRQLPDSTERQNCMRVQTSGRRLLKCISSQTKMQTIHQPGQDAFSIWSTLWVSSLNMTPCFGLDVPFWHVMQETKHRYSLEMGDENETDS